MAHGIVDCTGRSILKGMKVRTAGGRVIMVCGGMVNEDKLYNAETCEIVPDSTPTTPGGGISGTDTSEGTDCVVWGS